MKLDESPVSNPQSPGITNLTLRIEGMTCPGCAAHAPKALARAPGVIAVQIPGWRSGLPPATFHLQTLNSSFAPWHLGVRPISEQTNCHEFVTIPPTSRHNASL
ncbi:MAG TPA: hypothetical protein EYP25_11035 [Anaerolineae bacterium]|nr:hypothetical protein [Caldilineae bacterium]HID35076.1 hypothetical protein [Anaerolineae bacterium]HIQ12365.1 hypothetical protein [Caldilineales bacterium]